jgi:hypothetical protein
MRLRTGFLMGILLIGASAGAQKKADKGPLAKIAKPEGVAPITTVKPSEGFVEDAFSFDGPGGRLAWVRADAAAKAEVNVIDLAQAGATIGKVDVSAVTSWVTRVSFVLDGSKLFVVGKTPDELRVVAGLFDLTGRKLGQWGPASDVALTDVGGEAVVSVFDELAVPTGKTWTIAAFRLKDGKARGKKRTFKADADGLIKELDLRVLYFAAGYTQLVGLKKGEYDKTKDQRLNDGQAVYDVIDGRIIKNTPVQDLIAHQKLIKLRLGHENQARFLMVATDGRGLTLVTADDKTVAVAPKDLSFDHYLPDSLMWQEGKDGSLWFSLTIDPVNPEAVNKKKADPEHIDLYKLDPKTGQATRQARLAKDARPVVWSVAGGRWAVLRKHKGQERGGPELEVLELVAAGTK